MYELHDFVRSSAACRVRIALALKHVDYTTINVALTAGGQHDPGFRALNPQGLVPVYSDENVVLTQSLAIIEYLDERYPDPPLLPAAIVDRARARQFAQIIAADIHPLNGYRVHSYLRDGLKLDTGGRRQWFHYWLLEGLDALELWLTAAGGSPRYCVGDQVSIADIFLVPQLDVARRSQLELEDFPRLCAIESSCLELEAFSANRSDLLEND